MFISKFLDYLPYLRSYTHSSLAFKREPGIESGSNDIYSNDLRDVRVEKHYRDEKQQLPNPSVFLAKPKSRTTAQGFELLNRQKVHSPFLLSHLHIGNQGRKISLEATHGNLNEYLYAFSYQHPERSIKQLISQIILAVAALHKKNLVHRDIKPKNFFVYQEHHGIPHVVLADLEDVSQAHYCRDAVGTRKYIAPEAQSSNPRDMVNLPAYLACDKKALDCYALGLTLSTVYEASGTRDTHLQNLINDLLCDDPRRRCTIEQAMNHAYFGNTLEETTQFHAEITSAFEYEMYSDSYLTPQDYAFDHLFYSMPAAIKEMIIQIERVDNQIEHLNKYGLSNNHMISILHNNVMQLRTAAARVLTTSSLHATHDLVRRIDNTAKSVLAQIAVTACKTINISQLKHIIETAVRNFVEINQLNSTSWSLSKLFSPHGNTGKIHAQDLEKQVNHKIQQSASPLEVYSLLHNHLEQGDGKWYPASFKTLLAKQLEETCSLPRHEWFNHLSGAKEELVKDSKHAPSARHKGRSQEDSKEVKSHQLRL